MYVRTARGGHGHFQNRDDYREKICIQIVLQTGHTVNDCREHRGLDYRRGDLRGHGTDIKIEIENVKTTLFS